MPNWVSNTIAFDKAYADRIIPVCCPNGEFDFQTLIPSEESRSAQVANWNTKWNAAWSEVKDGDSFQDFMYSTGKDWCDEWLKASRDPNEVQDCYAGKILIHFETAWSPPFPVIEAFAEKFNIPFEYSYNELGMFFWGIVIFTIGAGGKSVLSEDRYSRPEDFQRCVGVGYDDFLNSFEEDSYDEVEGCQHER